MRTLQGFHRWHSDTLLTHRACLGASLSRFRGDDGGRAKSERWPTLAAAQGRWLAEVARSPGLHEGAPYINML